MDALEKVSLQLGELRQPQYIRPWPVLLPAVILMKQRGQVGVRKSPLVTNLRSASPFSGGRSASFARKEAPSMRSMRSFAAKALASGVKRPEVTMAPSATFAAVMAARSSRTGLMPIGYGSQALVRTRIEGCSASAA